jgi:hypothetical protein
MEESGAVYVFRRVAAIWSQEAYIKAANSDAGDSFGFALSANADGETVAVAARYEDSSSSGVNGNPWDEGAPLSGAVYVFTHSSGVWSQEAYVKASNPDTLDYFGTSVSLSADGRTLAVGANAEASNATGIDGMQGDNSAAWAGAVNVFVRASGGWTQQAYVKASNTDAGDVFGSSAALSSDGSTLAVGAANEGSAATGVNCDASDNGLPFSGAVYVFHRNDGAWAQYDYIKASNTGRADAFGGAVALSADGHVLAVGATGEASNALGIDGNQLNDSFPLSGAVYLFTASGGGFSQRAYVKASNTNRNDHFGGSLALSSDGARLVVGAKDEQSNAGGVGGNQLDNSASTSGAAYCFGP